MFLITSTGIDRLGSEDSCIRCFEALCISKEIAEEYVRKNTWGLDNKDFNSTFGNEFKIEEITPIEEILN